MQNYTTTADTSAQVAGTAQTTLVAAYGKQVTHSKKAFLLLKSANISRKKAKLTDTMLNTRYPNLDNMVEQFELLIRNAPLKLLRPRELQQAQLLLDHLKLIIYAARKDDYLDEVPVSGEHKVMYLTNVSRCVNYASLHAMDALLGLRNASYHPQYSQYVLTGRLISAILWLYVPSTDFDLDYSIRSLAGFLITYDQ